MRIAWISSQPAEIGCEHFADSNVIFSEKFSWNPTRFELDGDWAQERALLSNALSHDGLLISGMSLTELESIFRIRALQLLKGEGRLDILTIVLVRRDGERLAIPRFGRRMQSAWPFRSVLFIGDAPTVEFLSKEGLLAIDINDAKRSSLRQLFDRSDGALATAPSDQSIGVQIQPMWDRCGSSTPFANQIDALLDRNCFTIRIFIDSEVRAGTTVRRRLENLLPGNTIDAGPHIEAFACPAGDYASCGCNQADEAFLTLVRSRMVATIRDEVIASLAARASVAIVNHAVNIGFALRACPAARIVLETHDYLTRAAVEHARRGVDMPAFPTCASVKRHVQLENRLWRAADICISLSLTELTKIQRHCSACVYVVPRPYTRRSIDPGSNAQWDILIVADEHRFNVQSVDWFLEHVVYKDQRLARLRIAIVGRVQKHLEHLWRDRLQNVHWLGFVMDLDGLRDSARLSVCPDLVGTGISIKTLTAMAAEHPFAATRVALRGLGDKIFDLIPIADSAKEMKEQIVGLLDNDKFLKERRKRVSIAFEELLQETSHATVLQLSLERVEDRSLVRKELLKSLEIEPKPLENSIPSDGDAITLEFGAGGNATAFLGPGWHREEVGGRWTDGPATLQLPAAWVKPCCTLEISFVQSDRAFQLALKHKGKSIASKMAPNDLHKISYDLDLSNDKTNDDFVELEIASSSVFCPADEGLSLDVRVLGVYVKSLKIFRVRPETSGLITEFSEHEAD
jgi:hypothetical protein